MKILKVLLALGVIGLLGALGIVYSGVYPVGADVPHTKLVYWALETARERSIAARIGDIEVPPLDDAQLLLAGGPDYNDMCAGCHLKPGKTESDMSAGLYPRPPNLAQATEQDGEPQAGAARQFWIIKHGIKASAMPAWGPTHDDARIWAMVAFLQKLPSLTPAQYQILTARAEGDMGHEEHGSGGENESTKPSTAPPDEHDGMDMSGTSPSGMNTEAARTAQDVVDAFQTALKSGDARSALGWLAPDVLIYEGGGAERSRDEYATHHLQADMAFLKTSRTELLKRSSGESGDAAWVTTETRIRGQSSKGRDIDVLSTETALLRKKPQGWRIAHLHWSSQDYRPKSGNPK